MSHITQSVWVAGASGLVGRALLQELLRTPLQVHALVRKPIAGLDESPRLSQHRVDLRRADLGGPLPPAHALYICLGSTIAQAGSREAFHAVDHDAVLNVARAARVLGVRRCAVVSALGADPHSAVFYNRVKGEMEASLQSLGFERLVIARPSLLDGERAALGQPSRLAERCTLALLRPVSGLIPARWRPIQARRVARAMMLALSQRGPAVQVMESAELQTLGAS
jgi:uncharacterized protein YbjT (DUF2867 family)